MISPQLRRKLRPLRDNRLLVGGLQLAMGGDAVECPCCGSTFRRFRALSQPNRACWTCGSLERHRILAVFFSENPDLLVPGLSVLHVAPEPQLSARIRAIPQVHYVGGDLEREFSDISIDVTDLRQFDDGSFDAVICNHVLEHVPDDRQAMREFRRVLAPGGWALLQVPIMPSGTTYEDPSIITPEGRLEAFGQADHVRKYGIDYADRLREAGFDVKVDYMVDRLPPATVERLRLRSTGGAIEPVFFARVQGPS